MNKNLFGKGVLVLFSLILFVQIVYAVDVAYIYKKESKIDDKIFGIFEDLGLEVDLIQERDLPLNKDYRFIFVGDEKFSRPREIPVNNYDSIVVNRRDVGEWGIVDGDGASTLASNAPLRVKTNRAIQVYTQARYSLGSIGIPYYYLDEDNIARAMTKVAGTYDKGEVDLGDVVSYAEMGGNLHDGKLAGGNICFFGIVESDFWTEESEDLFLDCVGFVGQECTQNRDCGTDSVGNSFCSEGDLVREERRFTCVEPGTIYSRCEVTESEESVEVCEFGCFENQCLGVDCNEDLDCDDSNSNTLDTCVNPGAVNSFCRNEVINCFSDLDCGSTGFEGDEFCSGDNVYKKFRNSTCVNPGTTNSYCEDVLDDVFIQDCGEDFCEEYELSCSLDDVVKSRVCYGNSCSLGGCLSEVVNEEETLESCQFGCFEGSCQNECSVNSDCGSVSFSDSFCQGNIIVRNVTTPTCGTGSCNDEITIEQLQTCQFGCSNGICDTPVIECSSDSECNDNDDFTLDTCLNPGTPSSFCKYDNITCFTNNDCNDNNHLTFDSCLNPGTINSLCSNEPISCVNSLDCGQDSSENICVGDDVYSRTKEHACSNPGTVSSQCSLTENQVLIEGCVNGCVNGTCNPVIECNNDNECNDNDNHTLDVCKNPGTIESFCKHEDIECLNDNECNDNNHLTIDSCLNPGTINSLCSNQQFICASDADCQDDVITNICIDDDVYKNAKDYGCENPGTLLSGCTFENSQTLTEECSNGCFEGTCNPITIECSNDFECNDNSDLTIDRCENPGASDSFCENILLICKDDLDCNDDNDRTMDECLNPGTINSQCLNQEVECFDSLECNDNDDFTLDTCLNPGTTESLCNYETIICIQESDCGIDSSKLFCLHGFLYENFKNYECLDSGTIQSSCSIEANPMKLVEECQFGCVDGACLPPIIECNNNEVCDDNDDHTLDVCENPGTPESFCKYDNIACLTYLECNDNDEYTKDECINPGSVDSFCKNEDIICLDDNDCNSGICIFPGTTESFCKIECTENKVIDFYDTNFASGKVRLNDGDKFDFNEKIKDESTPFKSVKVPDPMTGNLVRVHSSISVESDGYLVFKNKYRDGGIIYIKNKDREIEIIAGFDNAPRCPGGDSSSCIYDRNGNLVYNYWVKSHWHTYYDRVLNHRKYSGDCSKLNIENIKGEKIQFCGSPETKVPVYAGETIYFHAQNSDEFGGTGLELWEDSCM
jgi:hypothetical protein